ncbi:hypothetical protein N7470_004397 [Penicillium chermesinum]|nr:hypothetical protein N7470_004397 [Penicillium chermesinum]
MLSIFLTEEIETRMEAVEDTKLLFYMCSHQDEKRNNAAAIMRSLIYQILTKSPRLFEHVSSYFEDSTRVQAALSSPHILWTILKLMLQANTDTIFCVLDGLDECDDESVRLIVEMFRQYFLSCPIKSTGKFKLIIVSRRVAGLDVFPHVRLDPDNNDNVSGDIQSFISERISRLQEIRGFDEIQEYVENSLLKRAQGTFLWVGFVTDELRKKTTCTEIVETLKDLPAGLPAIYSRVLMQTEECHRPMIAKILRWVTTAVRPLNLRELAAGIGLESTDVLKKGQIMLDYIRLCENLLEVHDKKITLVHQSVRDYLLQGTLASDPILGQFHIKEDAAHFEIAETCVQQLECGFSSQWNGEYDESIGWKYQQFELLEYAILHWTEHVKQASSSSNPNLASLFNRPFFQDQLGLIKTGGLSWRTTGAGYDRYIWITGIPSCI